MKDKVSRAGQRTTRRSVYCSEDKAYVLEEAENMAEVLGKSLNAVFIEGLECWIEKHRYSYLSKLREAKDNELVRIAHSINDLQDKTNSTKFKISETEDALHKTGHDAELFDYLHERMIQLHGTLENLEKKQKRLGEEDGKARIKSYSLGRTLEKMESDETTSKRKELWNDIKTMIFEEYVDEFFQEYGGEY